MVNALQFKAMTGHSLSEIERNTLEHAQKYLPDWVKLRDDFPITKKYRISGWQRSTQQLLLYLCQYTMKFRGFTKMY